MKRTIPSLTTAWWMEATKNHYIRSTITRTSLEELERSHYILDALMAGLSPSVRKELIGLLQVLSQDAEFQESSDSIHQRVLQIASGICKPHQIQSRLLSKSYCKSINKGWAKGGNMIDDSSPPIPVNPGRHNRSRS